MSGSGVGAVMPRRVVAIGGGTGLPSMLRGFKEKMGPEATEGLTAIVTMTDDGGSSGRLRRGLGVLPPGDLRNCMVALAPEEDLFSALFQHRFADCPELGGHTLGNLVLAALAERTGSFQRAVETSGRVLRIRGRILPATLDDVRLEAELEDGATIRGESAIGTCDREIRRIRLAPRRATPAPGVLDAIAEADLIVVGPGSLYTSVVPNLLVEGLADALRASPATCIYVGNLVHEPGEGRATEGAEHLRVLERHAGAPFVDRLVVHHGTFDAPRLERYLAEGSRPLDWTDVPPGLPVTRVALLADGPKLRHDPTTTVDAILDAWRTHRAARPSRWGNER